MNPMNKSVVLIFISLIFLLILSSCSVTPPEPISFPKASQCGALFQKLNPALKQSFTDDVLNTGKQSLHYLSLGLAGTTDVVLLTSAGLLVGVTICSPALLLDGYKGGHSNLTGFCIKEFFKEVGYEKMPFHITKWSRSKTQSLTCPSMKKFEGVLNEIQDCAQKKKEEEKKKIENALANLLRDPFLNKCVGNLPNMPSST